MAHCLIPEAEAVLDSKFPVLDQGFVRLIDYLGGDARVVQAARVSYGSGTKNYRQDAALIDYLLRNQHSSPFEQVVLTFHVKLPIFVARQWVRHRTARLNEISGRYSIMKAEFYLPALEDIAAQSTDNKQGRSEKPLEAARAEEVQASFQASQAAAYTDYTRLLESGLARELARANLPLSLYTEWYWQIDLHNLFHFLELRLDHHAQREIRLYAEVLLQLAKKVAPSCCAAFERHCFGGVRFSAEEFAELQRRLADPDSPAGQAKSSLDAKALERFLYKLQTGKQT